MLDNKVPRPIDSFQAFDGNQAPFEIILVVDDVNTGLEHVAYVRTELDKFFHANGGQLTHPTALAILTDSGLQGQDAFTTDGKALSAALDQSPIGLHTILRTGGIYSAVERFQVSIEALLQLAQREAARPGRKMIVWISPGWPVLSGPGIDAQLDNKQREQIFSNVMLLSGLLRQGRITMYSIDPLGSADFAGRAFYWEAFLKGPSHPNQAEWGNIALQVLAVQSGGLALTTSNDIAQSLQRCVADAEAYYELSFAPTLEHKPSEYHQIEVRVDLSGATARTRQGYYSRP